MYFVDYKLRNTHSIGSTLGRVTDFITNGNFINDNGCINELSKNHGTHHFNGGEKGFDKVIWDGYVSGDELVLSYSSRDGEEGYPGTLQARIIFRFTCKNELVIDYTGMTSKSTPVNISSNMFFNLAGHVCSMYYIDIKNLFNTSFAWDHNSRTLESLKF